jgi:hypothetical protein
VTTVRWHTEGRRQPVLIGKDASGRRIPGGPYVVWQLAALPLAPLLWHFRVAWAGGHSSFGALILTGAITAVVFVAIGRVDYAGRNPLLVLSGAVAGLVGAHGAPRGRLGGAVLRSPAARSRRRRPAPALYSHQIDQSPAVAAQPETRAEPAASVQPAPRLPSTQPATAGLTTTHSTSDSTSASALPAQPARMSPLESFLSAAGKG